MTDEKWTPEEIAAARAMIRDYMTGRRVAIAMAKVLMIFGGIVGGFMALWRLLQFVSLHVPPLPPLHGGN